MIELLSVQNTATFDTEGIVISELKKINFIYGANGSGKTSISNLIQNPHTSNFQGCFIKWKNESQLKCLVYNKNFRENNFGTGHIDGVFTLGQATNEEIKNIEYKKAQLNELKEQGIRKRDTLNLREKTLEQLTEDFRNDIWEKVYRKYKHDFKKAFVGLSTKKKFKSKIIYKFKNTSISKTLNVNDLKKRAKIIFGERLHIMTPIPTIDFNELEIFENQAIWSKKIIGKADIEMAKLIQGLNINDWVNEGRKYLQHSNICPFCQKETITSEFKEQLERFFDETYENDIKKLASSKDEYLSLSKEVMNMLTQIENYEKKVKDTKLDLDLFTTKIKTLSSFLATNRELILRKIKEPSRSITLQDTKPQIIEIVELISKANQEIEKHNRVVLNYSREKRRLISDIWTFIISQYSDILQEFTRKEAGMIQEIDNLKTQLIKLRNQYKKLETEIKEANKNITSVQPTVDAINDILKSYGFSNFEIVPSTENENQYQIKRQDGSIAETTLSEGEITFITFLYFLQLAKGSKNVENILEDRILIIDDPISSLDSNILFVVSSLIKELIKKVKKNEGSIKQIIILTHNVYFHKEVSFIDGRTKQNKDTYFWILRKNDNRTTIQCYEQQNPIQSSYALLWRELKNQTNRSPSLTIQNIMRRIIENYFKILGQYVDDELINAFENPQEKQICRSLISWINDGSHGMPDDLFVEQQEHTTHKYFDIFRKIFEKMGHLSHYEMMMN